MTPPPHAASLGVGPALSAEDFRRVRQIAYERAGLAIPAGKEGLVRSRVAKRLRACQLDSFADYLDAVEAEPGGEEMVRLIDLLTTNKTDFFREPAHFEYLLSRIAPAAVAAGRPLRIWSAGCSTGEEAYTLSMVLKEALAPPHRFRILATDISTHVVGAARAGVYTSQQLSYLTPERRKRWFTPAGDGTAVVVPELRAPISFANLNLIADWPMQGPFDLILCRNVMIYFDKATITRLVGRFHRLLIPGGHLFIGHSESLTAIANDYRYVQPAIYAK